MMKTILFFILIIFSPPINAQNIGIGTTNPDQSAQLDIVSTARGILVPRMDSSQMIAISNPATGLLVFNTTTGTFYYKNAIRWIELTPTIKATDCNSGTPKNYDICIDSSGSKYSFYIYFNTKWTKL